ncbi:MAG TPA: multicopper oxidase domain-containing protein [Anaerolineaceae bacterium]|nr:multicopper oxidase domain-containing protein [Anaerolineaceae bacterium]
MTNQRFSGKITRREMIKYGGGMLGALMGGAALSKVLLNPTQIVNAESLPARMGAAAQVDLPPNMSLVGTDGWIYLPDANPIGSFFPDPWAPAPFNTYMFGFRNVTGLGQTQINNQKMKSQAGAPLLTLRENQTFVVELGNLGLQMRPDLVDSHTLHFHGFRNAIPMFDGEPSSSVAVPIGRNLKYVYVPKDAGTYMWHCHFEDVEHVHMGMTGPAIIRPAQDGNTSLYPSGKYLYNDGDGSTGFDREFMMFMSEVWIFAHWADAHIQLPDWSDYKPDFYLLNGRSYPDTLAPNGGGTDTGTGDLIAPAGRPELQSQPVSSLIKANAGDRVALRFSNLGYETQSMTSAGPRLKVVGKDATLMRGRDGSDNSYLTSTITIGPGESVDAIFVAPPHQGGNPDRYMIYNRNYNRMNNSGGSGFGGQATEIHVYPAGTLSPQSEPNT